ncbi:MAG: hypothetical protein IPF92_11930 [Myxococcales bacterium]|nr:hypothetical protein [Myxococcales bacterium]MBL0198213.1 hypothetical protein [Myxococcales bacterium]HQY62282.1 hypothetical protein [Polyangiaceae bacterium]
MKRLVAVTLVGSFVASVAAVCPAADPRDDVKAGGKGAVTLTVGGRVESFDGCRMLRADKTSTTWDCADMLSKVRGRVGGVCKANCGKSWSIQPGAGGVVRGTCDACPKAASGSGGGSTNGGGTRPEPAACNWPSSGADVVNETGSRTFCEVIVTRGKTTCPSLAVGESRPVRGYAESGRVAEIYAVRSKVTFPMSCDKAKQGRAAIEAEQKCEAERDRLSSEGSGSKRKYAVYRTGTSAPPKCVGEKAVKVGGNDCGYRYCTFTGSAGGR